ARQRGRRAAARRAQAPRPRSGGPRPPAHAVLARRLRRRDVRGLRPGGGGRGGVMAVVSVVLPTYDRAHTLRPRISRLLEQRGVGLEVIVVDDGSRDDTPAVLATVRDPRLRVLQMAHGGVAAARNAGIAASRTPYVAFHDSDDVALPGRLAVPVEFLASH